MEMDLISVIDGWMINEYVDDYQPENPTVEQWWFDVYNIWYITLECEVYKSPVDDGHED